MRVRRVPVEPAAELVVNPAIGHRVERAARDGQRPRVAGRHVPPEQVLDRHRLGELRGAAPAAVDRVERGLDPGRGGIQERLGRVVRGGRQPGRLHESLDQATAGRFDLVTLLAPGSVHALEHLAERRHAVPRLVREVGPAIERPPVRRQEDGHRPAAAAGHRLDRGHVDLVEIGTLFAVHLDGHEARVQVPGRGLVLEGLALHDVAPVAGGIADAQEDRPVEQLRAGQRVGAPGKPVDRIVGVLEEVRTGLAGESVGHRRMVGRGRPSRRGGRHGAIHGTVSSVPGFLPSADGLHFANRFPPGPTVRLGPFDTRWLRPGDASAGLCGGMAWYVRERFEAGSPIPPDREAPANGSPLFQALVAAAGPVARVAPNAARLLVDRRPSGADGRPARRARTASCPGSAPTIDGGRLAMVGLVRHLGWNPMALTRATRSRATASSARGDATTLRIYDPNWPDRDDVTVRSSPTAIRQSTGEAAVRDPVARLEHRRVGRAPARSGTARPHRPRPPAGTRGRGRPARGRRTGRRPR